MIFPNRRLSQRFFATVTNLSTTTNILMATTGKCVLAPMVRTGELPIRLMALKHGADLVWGPETVDKAIIGTRRIYNTKINCIDFIKDQLNGGREKEKIVFRTYPIAEKGKLIFQLGTASAELAVEAAKIVAGDVAGIDVNAGCPKHFSIHAGMGAALLKNPEKLTDILTSLVSAVGIPNSLPISVKIRLLEPHCATLDLVRQLCTTGIARLTVHCRTIPMRPKDPAVRDVLSEIAAICRQENVECFANGDVDSRSHAEELIKEFGLDGCMIARAAEANPSVFRPEGPLPWRSAADEFLKIAVEMDNHFANTKFCLSRIVPGKSNLFDSVRLCKTHEQMCEAFGVDYDPQIGREESRIEKVDSQAVEKAKRMSETVKAAGGVGGYVSSGGKKLSERGVSSKSLGPVVERETQSVAAAI